MAQRAEMKIYKKKQIIFREGDYEPCMYDIHLGTVGIYANYGKEDEKLITKLGEDEFFGEMGLIEASPRSATAVALENDTRVQVISAETFNEYFQKQPVKVLMIMQHMSKRLRELTKDYMDACRTVSEAMEAEENGAEQSDWVKEHLKKFTGVYRESKKR